jgi:hypothetical protein
MPHVPYVRVVVNTLFSIAFKDETLEEFKKEDGCKVRLFSTRFGLYITLAHLAKARCLLCKREI